MIQSSNARRHFTFWCVCSLILPSQLLPQTCLSTDKMAKNVANFGAPGPDGLIHVTVGYGGLSSDVQASIDGAVKEWNKLSPTSGVKFDPPPAGTAPDILVRLVDDAQGKSGGCAAYQFATGTINFGQTFLQAARSNSTGTTIFVHELGHAMGLDDAGPNPLTPTIMNNPSNALPGACTNPDVPTSEAQASDASAVRGCTQQYKQTVTPPTPPPPGPPDLFAPDYGGTCYYLVTTTYYYLGDDYIGQTSEVTWSTCTN